MTCIEVKQVIPAGIDLTPVIHGEIKSPDVNDRIHSTDPDEMCTIVDSAMFAEAS